MNNVKIGVTIIVLGVLFGALFFYLLSQFRAEQMELGCMPQKEGCLEIESSLSITHVGVGVIVAALTLGLYMILFSKGEKEILERLEREKNMKLGGEKFSILLRAVDAQEQMVLRTLREQPGIEQNTLRLKTDLSKAKVSQMLSELERKRLVRREAKGKTFSAWLSDEF